MDEKNTQTQIFGELLKTARLVAKGDADKQIIAEDMVPVLMAAVQDAVKRPFLVQENPITAFIAAHAPVLNR